MTKRDVVPVEDEFVVLRLLQESDLPLTLSWRNQDSIRKWFLTTGVIPFEKHREWYQRYKYLDNDFVFIILAKEMELQPVGQIALYNIDWAKDVGEYGRLIVGNQQARGKGFAKRASLLLFHIGFKVFGLKQIALEVKQNNLVAISLYRSLGFLEMGTKDGLVTMFKISDS